MLGRIAVVVAGESGGAVRPALRAEVGRGLTVLAAPVATALPAAEPVGHTGPRGRPSRRSLST